MKKTLIHILVYAIVGSLLLPAVSASADQPTDILLLNGQPIAYELYENNSYIALEDAVRLGAALTESTDERIFLTNGEDTLEIAYESSVVIVNGEAAIYHSGAYQQGNSVFVSVALLSQAFGWQLEEMTNQLAVDSTGAASSSKLSVSVALPGGLDASADILGSIYIVPQIGDDYISTPAPKDVIIAKGESSGTVTVDIPYDSSVNYKVGARFISGDDRFYSAAYYTGGASVSSKKDANYINNAVTDIQIELLGQTIVTGSVSDVSKISGVYAIAQSGDQIADLYDTVLLKQGIINAKTGEFTLKLPSDITRYIIRFTSTEGSESRVLYYSEEGVTDKIEQAKVYSLSESMAGLMLTPEELRMPLPIVIDTEPAIHSGDTSCLVEYQKQTGLTYDDVNFAIVFYDDFGRMVKMCLEQTDIYVNDPQSLYVDLTGLDCSAVSSAKLIVWENSGVPLAVPLEIPILP